MNPHRRTLLIGGSLIAMIALYGGLKSCASPANRWGKNTSQPPRKPAGAPKPLRAEDIAPALARLDTWYAAHLSLDRYAFNPPATDDALDALAKVLGVELPPSYRQLYRWHDGENDDRSGHFYGLPLLPLKEVENQWWAWRKVLAYFKGGRYAAPGGGWPAGAVDPAYINPRWIPLTHDGSGNHIGIDLDPWPKGRVGQVILYGRDEDVKVVLADSLGGFLGWIADLLESGNYRLTTAAGEQRLRDFALRDPPVDHFHDGARKLLGAPGPYM